jgi:hypothetical protein
MTRRAILIRQEREAEINDTVLELSKVTEVKIDKMLFHLDSLSDGTWRLCYSSAFVTDIKELNSIAINTVEKTFHYTHTAMKTIDGVIKHSVSRDQYKVKLILVDSDVPMIHLEEDARGNWRLLYSKEYINKSSPWIELFIDRDDKENDMQKNDKEREKMKDVIESTFSTVLHANQMPLDELKPISAVIALSFIDGTKYYYGDSVRRPHEERVRWHHQMNDVEYFYSAEALAEKLRIMHKIAMKEEEDDLFSIVPEGIAALVVVEYQYASLLHSGPMAFKVA